GREIGWHDRHSLRPFARRPACRRKSGQAQRWHQDPTIAVRGVISGGKISGGFWSRPASPSTRSALMGEVAVAALAMRRPEGESKTSQKTSALVRDMHDFHDRRPQYHDKEAGQEEDDHGHGELGGQRGGFLLGFLHAHF